MSGVKLCVTGLDRAATHAVSSSMADIRATEPISLKKKITAFICEYYLAIFYKYCFIKIVSSVESTARTGNH